MKKVIIGIHGLKNKPSHRLLEKWWKEAMIEGLVGIGKYRALPAFDLVYWADAVYDKPLNPNITDENDPYFLDEIYTPAPKSFQTKAHKLRLKVTGFIVKQLKRAFLNNDLSLKHQTVAENIVQRYFRELDMYYKEQISDVDSFQCKARKIIVERVVSALRKYKKYDIFLIGHSMGSILGFDAICFEVPDIKINTFVTMGSPIGLPLVESKIASRQNVITNGKVLLQTPLSIENSWYNFSDIEDNIALNYTLSDEFIQNDKGVKPTDVLVNNNYIMRKKPNPHNVFGYLRTKEFSGVLSAFIEEARPGLFRRVWNWIIWIFYKRN